MPFEFYDEDANYRAQDDPPDVHARKKSGYGGRIAGFLFLVVAILVFVYHKQLLSLIGVDSNADSDKKDNGTSGKLGSIGNEDHYLTNHFNLDPSDASVAHKVNLTSCGVGDEACADFNRVTEEHKQRNDEGQSVPILGRLFDLRVRAVVWTLPTRRAGVCDSGKRAARPQDRLDQLRVGQQRLVRR